MQYNVLSRMVSYHHMWLVLHENLNGLHVKYFDNNQFTSDMYCRFVCMNVLLVCI